MFLYDLKQLHLKTCYRCLCVYLYKICFLCSWLTVPDMLKLGSYVCCPYSPSSGVHWCTYHIIDLTTKKMQICEESLCSVSPLPCCCCCCCLHIKSRSGLYSVLSNIRTGPTDADAFRGHRLTTQKGYTYQKEIKGPRKVNTHAII